MVWFVALKIQTIATLNFPMLWQMATLACSAVGVAKSQERTLCEADA
jgi:hypothetical protein